MAYRYANEWSGDHIDNAVGQLLRWKAWSPLALEVTLYVQQ